MCMLCSRKRYQPEMSEVAELLRPEGRAHEEEKRRRDEYELKHEQERDEERRHYEEQRAADRARYEELIQGLTERRPCQVEVGPESLKLTKLTEGDDIEAFLTTFEQVVKAHAVERDKIVAILAPQLTRKARLAYAAMTDEGARGYDRVKVAIFQ